MQRSGLPSATGPDISCVRLNVKLIFALCYSHKFECFSIFVYSIQKAKVQTVQTLTVDNYSL